jgi:hypothetical protein
MKLYPALKEVRTASLILLTLTGSAVFTLITLTMGAGAANATASLCMCVIIITQSRLGRRETCMHQAQQHNFAPFAAETQHKSTFFRWLNSPECTVVAHN